jgi:hypothetical protein
VPGLTFLICVAGRGLYGTILGVVVDWQEPTWQEPTWQEPTWQEPTWQEPTWQDNRPTMLLFARKGRFDGKNGTIYAIGILIFLRKPKTLTLWPRTPYGLVSLLWRI